MEPRFQNPPSEKPIALHFTVRRLSNRDRVRGVLEGYCQPRISFRRLKFLDFVWLGTSQALTGRLLRLTTQLCENRATGKRLPDEKMLSLRHSTAGKFTTYTVTYGNKETSFSPHNNTYLTYMCSNFQLVLSSV